MLLVFSHRCAANIKAEKGLKLKRVAGHTPIGDVIAGASPFDSGGKTPAVISLAGSRPEEKCASNFREQISPP